MTETIKDLKAQIENLQANSGDQLKELQERIRQMEETHKQTVEGLQSEFTKEKTLMT
jgi:gas vesicle protein